jgi:hypothetical protein
MAAGTLSAPGSRYGPCLEPCQHKDCAHTRAMASQLCITCGKPIGYEVAFFNAGAGDWKSLQHEECLYDEIAQEQT